MALATVAQVEAILGSDLDAAAEARVEELIDLIQLDVEDQLGRSAEATATVIETVTVSAYRTDLLLSLWPVASITSVVEDGTTLVAGTDYAAELATGTLTRLTGTHPTAWPFGSGIVVVTYDSATIGQLSALTARIAARAYRAGLAANATPSILAGLRQLTIGRWSATAESSADANPVTSLNLTDEDLRIVNRWRDRRP